MFSRLHWVDGCLDILKKCTSSDEVIGTLKALPKSMDEVYHRLLLNVPEAYAAKAHTRIPVDGILKAILVLGRGRRGSNTGLARSFEY